MNKPEHLLRQEGAIKRPQFCTCDDGYWMRDLIDPACHYHGVYAEDLRELIIELTDALEEEFGESRDLMQSQQRPWNLIQRAREATKCQP